VCHHGRAPAGFHVAVRHRERGKGEGGRGRRGGDRKWECLVCHHARSPAGIHVAVRGGGVGRGQEGKGAWLVVVRAKGQLDSTFSM